MISPKVCRSSRGMLILITFHFANLLLAQSSTQPPPTNNQELLKKRDDLYSQAMKLLFEDRKYSQGMGILQRVLVLEKRIYGPLHDKVVSRLKLIAYYYELLGKWAAAHFTLLEMEQLYHRRNGPKHWTTQDVKRKIQALLFRQKLTPEQRKELRRANALDKQVSQLKRDGRRRDALPLAKKILEIEATILGKKNRSYAINLNNLATLYESQGEYDKALPLLKEALEINEEVLGKKHPEYIGSLSNLGALYKSQGNYEKALPLYEAVPILTKQLQGEKHPNYATDLSNLASLYSSMGKFGKAESLYQQAMALTLEVVGKRHLDYALRLNNLASIYNSRGKVTKALPLYQEALALRKEILGDKHPSYATSLNNLAEAYSEVGEFGKAATLHQQSLALRKEILGEKHPQYASSLNNLAALYNSQGDTGKAISLYEEALTIRKKIFGTKHPSYADCLNNLAHAYSDQKDYDNELSLYREALALRKEILGEKHPEYALSLNNLAALLSSQEKYAEAETLYRKATELKKVSIGEKHPDYALSLNNLASLYQNQKKYSKALPLFKQALTLRRDLLGETHPDYAVSLSNLGGLYHSQGDYVQAEQWFLKGATAFLKHRALVSREGLQRAGHASSHSILPTLSGVLARNNKPVEAWDWLEKSLGRSLLDEVVARSNRTDLEQRQLDQLRLTIQQTEERLNQLSRNSTLTDKQKQSRQSWIREQSDRYAKLSQLYQQLEKKYGINQGGSYSLSKVQSALKSNEAFLTWIDSHDEHWAVLVRASGDPIFELVRPKNEDWTSEEAALPVTLYEALKTHQGVNSQETERLIRKVQQQRISPIETHLKDIEHIIILPSPMMDRLPVGLLLPEKQVSHVSSATLYTYLQQSSKPKSNKLLALGDPIFNPQVELKEKPLPDNGILITAVLVNSPADKAGLKAEHVLLTYGDTPVNSIDELNKAKESLKSKKEVRIKVWEEGKVFEKVIPTGQLGVILSPKPAKIALKNRRKQHWQLVSRGDNWNALPGTRVEVASIANLVDKSKLQVLLDSSASEQQLYRLASTDKLKEFKYLHFATHGKVNSRLPMESALILSHDELKSNVADLNANEPFFDGRLTAKEVALHWQLDADLVTLSACNSGLGKYAKGEGYMGFAQSFLIRGARSVVLSLWSVDDNATALLMSRFYENLIKKKLSKIDALREAKKWLRTLPRREVLKLTAKMSNGVARGPGRKKLPALTKVPMTNKVEDAPYAHPYYWSAFILIGDPH